MLVFICRIALSLYILHLHFLSFGIKWFNFISNFLSPTVSKWGKVICLVGNCFSKDMAVKQFVNIFTSHWLTQYVCQIFVQSRKATWNRQGRHSFQHTQSPHTHKRRYQKLFSFTKFIIFRTQCTKMFQDNSTSHSHKLTRWSGDTGTRPWVKPQFRYLKEGWQLVKEDS